MHRPTIKPNRSPVILTGIILALSGLLAFSGNVCPVSAEEPKSALSNLDGSDDLIGQIQRMNSDVKRKRDSLSDLNGKIEQYRNSLMSTQLESQSLKDQVSLIENRIAKQQLQIDIISDEIKRADLEIRVLDGRIGEQEERLERERTLLGALARKLYRQGFNRSLMEIMLANRSLTEFFDSLRSISRLQLAMNESLHRLQEIRMGLETEKSAREGKRAESQERKRQMEVARLQLEDERNLKSELLDETRSSETQYRYLLADLKREQQEADQEIQYLERSLRQKLQLAESVKADGSVLSWPVSPSRGITAYFHDKDYPFRYVFEHPGIDIRAYQGTPVRSAAAGVVARAKDAGMGYSYVMILHNNSISTVYGHISKIVAREDAFVERGEIIGYSGGQPGTPGAGSMTTGPHLHFEVRLDGIPVDPMKYMTSL
ncbi:peptidoglycan DD-metalloendopeptidase family protein [Candidatus Uhrbacteria bacterium]|nr:peptidoglycan DD-metalloendopeptidase family protein [Candidatus Uhrbacteria bacterium]